jgi:hypothetical protein
MLLPSACHGMGNRTKNNSFILATDNNFYSKAVTVFVGAFADIFKIITRSSRSRAGMSGLEASPSESFLHNFELKTSLRSLSSLNIATNK